VRTALISAAAVGSDGFLGALARYGLSGLVQRYAPFATFPYGTLAVNLLGCIAIGVAGGLAESRQVLGPEAGAFVIIGVLGGFTTFSTLGYDTFGMLRNSDYLKAVSNVGLHVVLGLTFVWLGYAVAASR
jgi:CrcB protein